MVLIGYSKCSTVQKAKAWLTDHGIVFSEREIKTERPSYEELKLWQMRSGLPLKRFFNTSGLLYRSMELGKKLPNLNEDEQLTLLASDGMLVKRPLLIGDDFILVGFREKEWREKLLSE